MKKETEKKIEIPEEVKSILALLGKAGFEAYVVGGCVRDALRGEKPNDWDVTTSAKPEEILQLFPGSFYENKFLTVTVKTDSDDPTLAEVEVTTFRAEGRYTDKRHPDEVRYAKTLIEDLSRRDFTVNAIALRVGARGTQEIIDPFFGQKDMSEKIIRAVGDPKTRFAEDALRMLRAVRFSSQLGFVIEDETRRAILDSAGSIQFIARERIRDEIVKIIFSPVPKEGFELLHEVGLLRHIILELEEGIDMEQRGPHKYTVWEHNLRALEYACKENFSLRVRLAALFHDVGKSRTRVRRGGIWTFYGHDVAGAKMTYEILMRLHFSEKESEIIANLVRRHLFSYKLKRDDQYKQDMRAMGEDPAIKDMEDAEDMQETTDSAIRRLIRNVGEEYIKDLVKVRICDRVATGVPKAIPYRLRHFQFRVEKILREGEATNVKMLSVRGNDILERLKIRPGPRVGHILNALLEEVLDDPAKNKKEYLYERMNELNKFSDDDLMQRRKEAEEKVEAMEDTREQEIKKKYRVS